MQIYTFHIVTGLAITVIVIFAWQVISQKFINKKLMLFLQTFNQDLSEKYQEKIKDDHKQQTEYLNLMQTSLRDNLSHYGKGIEENLGKISQDYNNQLRKLSQDIEQRLDLGFTKTNTTFTDIVKRLSLIDAAQKNLDNLGKNISNLQQLLADKRSRGLFGEVQLQHLVENVFPTEACSFQHQFSNGLRCDCLIKLPAPTGNIVIDAKFPLENFQKMASLPANSSDKNQAAQLFKADIKKHVQDISQKYIIPGETASSAIMFIPAEAIFATIHADYPELVQFANKAKIWLSSPTTLMAILSTASGILKDEAIKKHISTIQHQLLSLAQDFSRFDDRFQKLAKHIQLTCLDVEQVQASAKKITAKFKKIESMEEIPAE